MAGIRVADDHPVGVVGVPTRFSRPQRLVEVVLRFGMCRDRIRHRSISSVTADRAIGARHIRT
jgi:hypothetical protein